MGSRQKSDIHGFCSAACCGPNPVKAEPPKVVAANATPGHWQVSQYILGASLMYLVFCKYQTYFGCFDVFSIL